MRDTEDRLVDCRISNHALQQFDGSMNLSSEDQLRVFNEHRQAIEALASRNYDEGRFDENGKVLISVADVRWGHTSD